MDQVPKPTSLVCKLIVGFFLIALFTGFGVGGWMLWSSLENHKQKAAAADKKTAELAKT